MRAGRMGASSWLAVACVGISTGATAGARVYREYSRDGGSSYAGGDSCAAGAFEDDGASFATR